MIIGNRTGRKTPNERVLTAHANRVMQGLNGNVKVLTKTSKRTGAMHRYTKQEIGDDGRIDGQFYAL